MRDDHDRGIPDYRRLAREIGQSIAATRPPNVMVHNGRAFWKLTDVDSGALAWLAFTRPDARSGLARRKVWTLIPQMQVFVANWLASVDRGIVNTCGSACFRRPPFQLIRSVPSPPTG